MVRSHIGAESQYLPSGAAEPTRDDKEWLAAQAPAPAEATEEDE